MSVITIVKPLYFPADLTIVYCLNYFSHANFPLIVTTNRENLVNCNTLPDRPD